MKDYKEMTKCVLEARDEYEKKKNKRNAQIKKYVPVISCMCLSFVICFTVWNKTRDFEVNTSTSELSGEISNVTLYESETENSAVLPVTDARTVPESSSTSNSSKTDYTVNEHTEITKPQTEVYTNQLSGNNIYTFSNYINETISILQKEDDCELIVGSDLFMTPSAKFADLLLPGTSVFEGNNIALPWTFGSYVLHNTKAIEPLFGCQFEYEWIKLVAKNLGLYDEFTAGHESVDEWLEACYNETRKIEPELPEYEVFKARGGHVYEDQKHVVAYEKQIKEGIPFPTPSGKIEIFSPRLYDMNNPEEIPGIPKYTPCVEGPSDPLIEKYPLQLIGYHTKRRCHSVHDNNDYMEQLDPPAIWIHPEDAKDRNIVDGEMVQVFNDRGIVQIPAKVTTRIMKGVIAMSQGGWYTPNEEGIDTRGSINVLTLTHKPSPLAKGNPQHTNLADVRKL